MSWQTTYPTLETVMLAGLETLMTWSEKLPAPQTDVERTIRRRISVQRHALAAAEVSRKAPDLAKALDGVYRDVERLTGVKMPTWFIEP